MTQWNISSYFTPVRLMALTDSEFTAVSGKDGDVRYTGDIQTDVKKKIILQINMT